MAARTKENLILYCKSIAISPLKARMIVNYLGNILPSHSEVPGKDKLMRVISHDVIRNIIDHLELKDPIRDYQEVLHVLKHGADKVTPKDLDLPDLL